MVEKRLLWGRPRRSRRVVVGGVVVLFAFVAVSGVALGQTTPTGDTTAGGMLCGSGGGATALGSLVDTAIKVMFSLGLVAALAMYKFNTIVEMVTFSHSQKRRVKEKKRDIGKAVFVLVGAGPLFVLLSQTTFGAADCVNFIPWA